MDTTQVPFDAEIDYFKAVAFDSERFFGKTCGFQVKSNFIHLKHVFQTKKEFFHCCYYFSFLVL